LSSGRANSARRILVGAGVNMDRISRVEGLADRDLLVKNEPNDPRNRRISVTLLRKN
jgi:chemotaxis protein MotB